MTYSTLMVHLDLGTSNEAVLRITTDLAERFKASVIGTAACRPMLIAYGDGYMNGDVIVQDRVQIEKETNEAEARFRAALHGKVSNLEWRSTVSCMLLADYIARQARAGTLSSPVQTGERHCSIPRCWRLGHACRAACADRPSGRR